MVWDILVQIFLLLLGLLMLFSATGLPRRALSGLRHRLLNRAGIQAKRHFVLGAQLLARARAAPANRAAARALAKDAIAEADKALSIDPKDAASHILKALALEFQGRKNAALKSIDAALAHPAVKTLSDRERGDSLFKRAELRMEVNRRRRVDSAVEDLVESVRLSPENVKAYCLLGECYEQREEREAARKAYGEARRVDPSSVAAREGLIRLGATGVL
ncbi:hypothetical protein Sjap_010518 [Stephania japonica]|uniref:Tetratricopeptide repeat protein n=1 Tax=Stephania japonica TaxID=461633 RepID=A0AAP0P774_9MAGN